MVCHDSRDARCATRSKERRLTERTPVKGRGYTMRRNRVATAASGTGMPTGDARTPLLHPTGPVRSIGALRLVRSVADNGAKLQRQCSDSSELEGCRIEQTWKFSAPGSWRRVAPIAEHALWNLAGNGLPLLAGAVAIPPLLQPAR